MRPFRLLVVSGWLVALTNCCPPLGAAARYAARTGNRGTVEGYVFDKQTGDGVAGVSFYGGVSGQYLRPTTTDEHGHYTLQLQPTRAKLFVWIGGNSRKPVAVSVRAGHVTRVDLFVDHADVVAERQLHPPRNCPDSAAGAVVDGHTTTQQDIDDIAGAVLARFAKNPSTMPDHALLGDSAIVNVNTNVGTKWHISLAAILSTQNRKLIGRPYFAMQDEADSTGHDIYYINISDVTSDGSCAFVSAGVDFMTPTSKHIWTLCCCTGHDIYEKRDGHWTFVRSDYELCS
jgi:hypothetical protein